MKTRSRKAIAVVLVAAMIIGMMPTMIFAGEKQATISYVALGDSMSQGYMFNDYKESPDNYCGFGASSEESSICMFKNFLENKYDVVFKDLSVQGMQPDEIIALFRHYDKNDSFSLANYKESKELTDTAKTHFKWWIGALGSGGLKGPYNGNPDKMAAEYVDALRDADIITYDIGINYFGSYLTDNLGAAEYNDDFVDLLKCLCPKGKEEVKKLYAKLKGLLPGDIPLAGRLVDVLMYAYVSFIVNTDECISRIYEINPDVKIIVSGLYNILPDVKLDLGDGNTVNISKALDLMLGSLNLYASSISKYSKKYAFADLSGKTVISFTDDLYYDPDNNDQDTINNMDWLTLELSGRDDIDNVNLAAKLEEARQDATANAMLEAERNLYKEAVKSRVLTLDTIGLITSNDMAGALAEMGISYEDLFNPLKYEHKYGEDGMTETEGTMYSIIHWFIKLGANNSARSFGIHPCHEGQKIKFEALKSAYTAGEFGIKARTQTTIKAAKATTTVVKKASLSLVEKAKQEVEKIFDTAISKVREITRKITEKIASLFE